MAAFKNGIYQRYPALILLGIILLKFIFQYTLLNPAYELQRDEYLHLDQANHLAWGFISVPPFSSWIAYMIKLLGNGIFWIRFFPAAFGALTIVCTWHIAKRLKGSLYACVLAAIAVCFSSLVRINTLFQPNSFEILAWTFIFYSLVSFVETGKNKWLYFTAITIGIGFLNKYNIVFPLIGLFAGLLISSQRKVFFNKHLYVALIIFILIILPNIGWQFFHGFPVIQHMKELSATQLVNNERGNFIKEQLLFFIGSIILIIISFFGFAFYKPFHKHRFLFYSYIITIVFYIYLKAKGYYAFGLYPALIAFGTVYFEYLFSAGWKRLLRGIAIAVVVLMFIPFINIGMPLSSPMEMKKHNKALKEMGLLRWEDGKDHDLPQDFADMLGWKELALKTDSIYQTLKDRDHTLILTDNYGQAGAINFYAPHIKHAVSFNADYATWFPDLDSISAIILIKEAGEQALSPEEAKHFKKVITAGIVTNPFAREYKTTISLLLGVDSTILPYLKFKAIQERKKYMH
ncbi:MAG: glycosyltransferase family 39 protein [Ferruginibacter sp.]